MTNQTRLILIIVMAVVVVAGVAAAIWAFTTMFATEPEPEAPETTDPPASEPTETTGDPNALARVETDGAVTYVASLEELLARADVISLHCPLTEETRGLIGREAFRRMKRGALLINTARGAVVDTDALVEAFETGILSGAGLDVYPNEPEVPQRLLALKNVVCTPHIGTNTEQTRREMAEACARQILDALAGLRPENIVNGI